MATIPDITIPSDSWVSLNTLSGVAVGSAMEIQNKGVSWIRLYISSTQPSASLDDGAVLTNLKDASATASVSGGSDEIWARCSQTGRTGVLNVQEV